MTRPPTVPPPEDRLHIGGRAIEWRWHGPAPAAAPSVVMLHEGLGCTALWRDLPRRLSDATGWGIGVYSRAGYGRSDPVPLPRPLDYMTREAVEVLPRVLDAFGIAETVLLGHSDGATIAAIHAGRVRDPRVRGLILMAPHFFTEPMGLAAIARARQAFRDTDLRARLGKYHDHPDIAFGGWCDAWLDPGFRDWSVEDAIDGWRVPVLAIQGENDEYGTAAQVDVITRRAKVPVEIHLLPACRHSPHLDQPETTLGLVERFLARLISTPE